MADAERLVRLIQEAGLEGDRRAEALLKISQAAGNRYAREQAAKALRMLAAQEVSDPFPDRVHGPGTGVVLGYTPGGDAFTVSREELSQHLAVFGRSGAGKTTLIYQVLDQVGVPWWSFDLKQDYRHLLRETDLVVFPAEEVRFNPLEPPPGVRFNQWVQVFAGILADSQALLNASENFTKKSVRRFAGDLETYGNRGVNQPSLYQVLRAMENRNINFVRKESNYRDTVVNRVRGIYDDLPETFQVNRSMDLVGLLDRNVVFELGELSTGTQNFVMEMLLAWIYQYRKAQNHRGQGLRHLTVADEGKTMFSTFKEQSVEQGIPNIDDTFAKLREFEEGVIVGDQESRKVTESLKSNTYTKVLLSTANAKELREMSDTLGLSTFQEQAADRLGVGEAVVRKADGPATRIRIPEFDLEKDVSDREIRERMRGEWERYRARAEKTDNSPTPVGKGNTGGDGGERSLDEF